MSDFPFTRTGVLISQPFGEFFATSIPARILLDVTYSDKVKAIRASPDSYKLDGSQRNINEKRLREIGQFIDTPYDAAFPNSIILAANYRETDGLIEEDEGRKWRLRPSNSEISATLEIPTDAKLAPIIDGQHRLFGFRYASSKNLSIPLLCAIFFDLPKPYQAFLFATVNANQRSVSKSLTYELFGYNVEEETPEKWTPEKLAVFITRKLGTDKDSPFYEHITVAAENDFAPRMADVRRQHGWAVSTATVVEGIIRLISRSPKADAAEMGGNLNYKGNTRSVLNHSVDPSPLRKLYLSNSDEILHNGIRNFFVAANKTLWTTAKPESYIRKTVGIQALFDIARKIMSQMADRKDFREVQFEQVLGAARKIDFADRFFQTSGTGRQRIRNCLELSLGLKTLDEIGSDRADYQSLTGQ